MKAEAIIYQLRAHQFHFVDEQELQEQISSVLTEGSVDHQREFRLGNEDRPDFWIPTLGLVIEVKIKGSVGMLLRQLRRYAKYPQVLELVVVTSKRQQFLGLPAALDGKPLWRECLWLL